jgi:Domain of unknown function (DUF397)
MERLNPGWRKSSYSGNGGANCVETGSVPGAVLIRDSKERENGPILSISPADWSRFTASITG